MPTLSFLFILRVSLDYRQDHPTFCLHLPHVAMVIPISVLVTLPTYLPPHPRRGVVVDVAVVS